MNDQITNINHPDTQPAVTGPSRGRVAAVLVAGLLAASVGNIVIAAIAHQAGASTRFMPLDVGTFLPLTVIGFLAGLGGWSLIRARALHPTTVLRRAVPIVVVLSFIPDIAVLASGTQKGVSAGAVITLMLMHVMVAAAAVPAFVRALPLRTAPPSSS